MLLKILRIVLYVLAGLAFPLLGWSIGESLVTDLNILQGAQNREIIIFPCVAIVLSIGMVITEIFVSNPGRPKLSIRKAIVPCIIALIVGLVGSLIASGIYQVLFIFNPPPSLIRMSGWLLIGLCVGITESLSWAKSSIEAGNTKRFQQRLLTSIGGAFGASFIATLVFEFLRNLESVSRQSVGRLDDPIGFAVLGLLLGLTFAFTNSPSYSAALRAGAGFEFKRSVKTIDAGATRILNETKPIIASTIKFVGRGNGSNISFDDDDDGSGLPFAKNNTGGHIQEGLSIQLPGVGKVNIGSDKNKKADIKLPDVAIHIGFIVMEGRTAYFAPNKMAYESIFINGEQFDLPESKSLKHGSVIKICKLNPQGGINEEEFYRFVYYNRFLDPDS